MENKANLMAVPVSFDFVIDMMRQGWSTRKGTTTSTTKGLPPDAVFVYSFTDQLYSTAYFVFYHPSFPEVMPGERLPIFTPEMRVEYEAQP